MRDLYTKVYLLAKSKTARDTYILFAGNSINAAMGMLFTLLIARALTANEFGVFSAVNNLVYILIPITDLGTTSGLVRFVAELETKGKIGLSLKYIKAAFVFKLLMFVAISALAILFAWPIATKLLVSNDISSTYWVLLISLGMFLPSFIPAVLQAKKQFLKSTLVDVSYAAGRVLFIFPFLLGGLTLVESFQAFALTGVLSFFVIAIIYGFGFMRGKPTNKTYKNLLQFSGWLGVNKMISTLASRIDVQILAIMSTAVSVGYYSLAVKLAFFVSFLSASFSAVLAPRLASFGNAAAEVQYLKKSALPLIPVSMGIIIWAIFARPFIVIFGEQYLPAVDVFRVLLISMIPFLFTVPSVTAIIYAMKEPKYIGRFSIFQLLLVVILNVLLIPSIDVFAPAITFGVINTLLAIYTWAIVIRHYRKAI